MMTEQQSREQFKRLFIAYPSYRQWIESQESAQETFSVWVGMLRDCDQSDVIRIIDGIVSGDIEPVSRYEKPDMLPRNIKRLANDLKSQRNERARVSNLCSSRGAMAAVGQWETGHIAIVLGTMVRSGEITKEENDKRMIELMAWDKGGERLPWMDEMLGVRRKKNVLGVE